MDKRLLQRDQRLSRAQKEANDFQWYKNKVDLLDTHSMRDVYGIGGVSEYHRMKVNYDLFNNIINLADFEHVHRPFGEDVGELPAKMVNRDIISNKIKAILGLEMRRPFDYKVLAVNSEATTRKEQAESDMIREYVINSIMTPIKKQIELQHQQQIQGQELSQEQTAQIEQQIEEQLKAMTPEEVGVYMERKHQDPAEVMCHQLLEYLIQKREARDKFSNGCKHAAISAKEFYWVGEVNGEPDFRVLNPLRANYDDSPDLEFVEKGEWFTYEYRMTPSECIAFFADDLKESEIDSIYEDYSNYTNESFERELFDFSTEGTTSYEDYSGTVRVFHAVWKSLREVKFLTYTDENGEIQETIVDESYKIDYEAGDINLYSEWIPETYETWKIGSDIYKKMRPVIGQFRDMDNLYDCPLPYFGGIYDNTNSRPTSIVDRGRVWQYWLNIFMFRLETVAASDKGKKVLMNINAIPDSTGIDIKKFQYFFESSPFGWFNPNEEGVGYSDVNTIAKVIDLSTASDMAKYIDIINMIKQECGEAMGVSRQMEAQISPDEAVRNTQQALTQTSYILEPFFNFHSRIKRNVLQALLECAKVCYAEGKQKKLSYILDDMSYRTLTIDGELLEATTIGLFIQDSTKAQEIKDTLNSLAHAAMQTQTAKFSDILTIFKEDSITIAEEKLRKAEREAEERAAAAQQAQAESQERIERMISDREERKFQHEKELAVLKEEEKRKTEVIKGALVGASFNPDADADGDGENDFFEIAKHGLDAEIKRSKNQLDRDKFEHQKGVDKEKLKNDKEKIAVQKAKNAQKQ